MQATNRVWYGVDQASKRTRWSAKKDRLGDSGRYAVQRHLLLFEVIPPKLSTEARDRVSVRRQEERSTRRADETTTSQQNLERRNGRQHE
jgi:hypothetical protein